VPGTPPPPPDQASSSPGEPPQRSWPWLEENATLPRPGRGGSPLRALDEPTGDVTEPDDPIPVIVHLYWLDGWEADVPAAAEAWTRDAVRVRWLDVDTQRSHWVPASTVRRRAGP
jgi:hypothetical protein